LPQLLLFLNIPIENSHRGKVVASVLGHKFANDEQSIGRHSTVRKNSCESHARTSMMPIGQQLHRASTNLLFLSTSFCLACSRRFYKMARLKQ
jgi:hypothetical protein